MGREIGAVARIVRMVNVCVCVHAEGGRVGVFTPQTKPATTPRW